MRMKRHLEKLEGVMGKVLSEKDEGFVWSLDVLLERYNLFANEQLQLNMRQFLWLLRAQTKWAVRRKYAKEAVLLSFFNSDTVVGESIW